MTPLHQFTTKADKLLILLLLVAGVFLTAAVYLPQSGKGGVLEVRQNGALLMTLPLDKATTRTISDNGHENQFSIKNGTVTMTKADCHDQTCVRTRGIHTPGQSIVCLPHRIVLTITATGSVDDSLDAVVQ